MALNDEPTAGAHHVTEDRTQQRALALADAAQHGHELAGAQCQIKFLERRHRLVLCPRERRLAHAHRIMRRDRRARPLGAVRRHRQQLPRRLVKLLAVEKVGEAAGRHLRLQKHAHDARKHREREVEQLVKRKCGEGNVSRKRLGARHRVHDERAERHEKGDGLPEEIEARRRDADALEQRQLLTVAHVKQAPRKRLLPRKQLDRLDVDDNLVHDARPAIAHLHLRSTQPAQVRRQRRVQRDAHNHDRNTNKRRPAEQMIQRHERNRDLKHGTPQNVRVHDKIGQAIGVHAHQIHHVARCAARARL